MGATILHIKYIVFLRSTMLIKQYISILEHSRISYIHTFLIGFGVSPAQTISISSYLDYAISFDFKYNLMKTYTQNIFLLSLLKMFCNVPK